MIEANKKPTDYEFQAVSAEVCNAIRAKMKAGFKETQMRIELQLFHDRLEWVQKDELSKWFLASRERLALFHRFNLQGFSDGHTVSMESRALGIDRSQISRMLSEAHSLGFIYRNKEPKKQRYYLPSNHLLRNGDYFVEYHVNQILDNENHMARRHFFDYKRCERNTRIKMR